MASRRPIYYDTETTGINPERERIIEIAAYDPVRGKTFERLINPGMSIPKDAQAIHKITDDMVKEAGTFKQVAAEFMDFCEGDVALIAHNNAAFDLPFLRAEFRRSELVVPHAWIYIDSLKWARRYRRDLPRHSLQYLRQMYGIAENQAHRALNDVMVLFEVFSHMVGDLTIEDIHRLLIKAESKQDPTQKQQPSQVATPLQNEQVSYSLFS